MTDDAVDVVSIGNLPDQCFRLIDDGDVVILKCQMSGNVGADLAGTAYDNFHSLSAARLMLRQMDSTCLRVYCLS